MHSRDSWILGGVLALVGLGGLLWFGQSAAAEELAPPDLPPAAELPFDLGEPDAPPPGDAAEPLAAALPTRGGDGARPGAAGERQPTAGWTSGVIRGDIQLAVSVLSRLESITVVVEEARRPVAADGSFSRPTRRMVPVERGRGTPTFEVTDVPFSDYPYVVSVFAPGLNGSRCTISVDAMRPLVDDVVLAITPGTPLTLLVRDQDFVPFIGVELALVPVGEPAGRPHQGGVTDNFGSLVLEDVLAGDYQLLASHNGQSLQEPQTISVPTGGRSSVRAHSHALVIERGVPVRLSVHDAGGYPLVGATVTATATDRIKHTSVAVTTDALGNASFNRLQPGTWQFTVEMDRWLMWDVQRTLQPHQDPLFIDVRMVPVRR